MELVGITVRCFTSFHSLAPVTNSNRVQERSKSSVLISGKWISNCAIADPPMLDRYAPDHHGNSPEWHSNTTQSENTWHTHVIITQQHCHTMHTCNKMACAWGILCIRSSRNLCLQEALMVGCISPVFVVVDVTCHCFLQAMVEEFEKKLREAHTKGLEEAAEETNSQAQSQVGASQTGEDDGNTQPSQARGGGDGSGGVERSQVEGSNASSKQAEELSTDMEGRTEREPEMSEDKENNAEEGAVHPPVTPPTSER